MYYKHCLIGLWINKENRTLIDVLFPSIPFLGRFMKFMISNVLIIDFKLRNELNIVDFFAEFSTVSFHLFPSIFPILWYFLFFCFFFLFIFPNFSQFFLIFPAFRIRPHSVKKVLCTEIKLWLIDSVRKKIPQISEQNLCSSNVHANSYNVHATNCPLLLGSKTHNFYVQTIFVAISEEEK